MNYLKVTALAYLSGVLRYRWYALAAAWIICLLGWGAVAALPDRYTAEARVYIDTDSIMDPLLKGLTVRIDSAQEIAIMLKRLITRPTLAQVIHLTDPSSDAISQPEMQQRVQALQDAISIRGLQAKNYYAIGYTDTDPKYATSVTQTLLSILQDNNVGSTRLDLDSARSFINKQIADYEARLRDADKRRADFKTAHIDIIGRGTASNQLDTARQALEQAKKNRNIAIARRDSIRAQLAAAPATVPMDERLLPRVAGSSATAETGSGAIEPSTDLVQRLRRAQTLLDELLTRDTDNHPDVIATRALIHRIQDQIAAQAKQPRQSVMVPNPAIATLQDKLSTEETNVAQQQEQVSAAAADLERAQKDASRAIDIMAQYNGLDRDYGNIEKTYQALLQSREQADISQARDDQLQGISFRILEPPQRPQFPTGPNRPLLNSAVLLLGLAGGLGLSVLLTLLSDRFLSPGDVVDSLGLPVLGIVSAVPQSLRSASLRLSWATVSAAGMLLLVSYVGVLTFVRHSLSQAFGL
jgi:protein tyrosine kinase modulator